MKRLIFRSKDEREQIIRDIRADQAANPSTTTRALLEKHKVSVSNYYAWSKKYPEETTQIITHDVRPTRKPYTHKAKASSSAKCLFIVADASSFTEVFSKLSVLL